MLNSYLSLSDGAGDSGLAVPRSISTATGTEGKFLVERASELSSATSTPTRLLFRAEFRAMPPSKKPGGTGAGPSPERTDGRVSALLAPMLFGGLKEAGVGTSSDMSRMKKQKAVLTAFARAHEADLSNI